ncbi:(+)-neomenthol dehydrogenase isoform X1 [Coffea arabica]|uniref:(+)-neomenthol dehydrogenase isoform X1 n=1 Tax=Coffea arabica TaxID=13443 RepID=A0A6P6TH20_COFAR|nr:(+)-neomenthol dehydrogenase-like isoform X4 [Coffea arabica]
MLLTQFGRLDVLVNNAAVLGNIHDHDVRRAALHRKLELELTGKLYAMRHMKCQWNAWKQIGPKRMVEAFLPLLQSSQSPSIVNASSLVGKLEVPHGAKGWPLAYAISKASLNAYTRILAKKLPSFKVICVYPGYVKTDMGHNIGLLTPEEGAESPVRLALLPDDGPSGLFFSQKEVSSFE